MLISTEQKCPEPTTIQDLKTTKKYLLWTDEFSYLSVSEMSLFRQSKVELQSIWAFQITL